MKKLIVNAKIENLEIMIQFILEKTSIITNDDKKIENQLRLALEEALVNVINYAYDDDGDIIIKFEEIKKGRIQIQIIDYGIEFDPLKKEDPDIMMEIEERQIGGLGIFMVKQIMDNVTYKRENGMNILTMEKEIK